MTVTLQPIGYVRHDSRQVPKHWTESELEGVLDIFAQYRAGLTDIRSGQRIAVLFHFHQSPPFDNTHLRQKRRGVGPVKGVFSLCSPIRPNPIGYSVLEVLEVNGCRIRVKGLDMRDGTPILDIKPDHA